MIMNQWPMGESKVLGGGGPGMYSIVLPRSVYWQSASEWVQVNSQQPAISNDAGRRQIVCNGNLWTLSTDGIKAIDLASGAVVDTIPLGVIPANTMNYTGSVATDGRRYIWFGESGYNDGDTQVYQVDVVEKTVAVMPGISIPTSRDTVEICGPMVYSKIHNALFVFGAGHKDGSYNTSQRTTYKVDLTLNQTTQLTSVPTPCIYGYAWSDELTGDIYVGGTIKNAIYRFSPESNTFTTISSNFTPVGDSSHRAWLAMGDTIYCVSKQGITPFDPRTGNTLPGPTPQNPGFDVTASYAAVSGNTLYLSHSTGLYKCVLYENLPADAPIVAKIYKGNKYHSIQPFTIHGEGGDVQVTTKQQTAGQDIPIKMYTYDNAGGQVLIVETGGDA